MSQDRWAVVGATAWGLTLAQMLAEAGTPVDVLCRGAEEAALLAHRRTIPARTARIRLPLSVGVFDYASVTSPLTRAILAVPSQSMRANAHRIAGSLGSNAVLISAAKGLEVESAKRMTEVIAEECGAAPAVLALSGPNLADEIARGLPAAAVLAGPNLPSVDSVIDQLSSARFRVYSSDDVTGVEIGGALKNIIAIVVGICHGLGYGDNAKAALIARGLAEIARLGVADGARTETFSGLSGMGDLVATCTSPFSRNRRVGEELGHGRTLADVLATLGHVAEGVPATGAAYRLAARLGVHVPLIAQLHRVLFEGLNPEMAARELMNRPVRPESSP